MIRFPPPGNIRLSDAEMAGIFSAIAVGAEDAFLEDRRFVPGILLLEGGRAGDPQESLEEYERILDQIKRIDPARFAHMHKGTPYYVMGWLAYYLKDYERGVFYMDAALSEDVANNPHWQGTPAAAFLFLDPSHPDAAAKRIVNQMRAQVDAQVAKFAGVAGVSYTTYDLVDKFVRPKANDPTHRSIVTALMDEVLNFLNRRKAMADLFYAFLDNLVRTATGMNGCVAIISLPRSRIEMASDWDMEWQDRITRIIRRVARELLANDESEISEVVRRRLFEDLGAERTRRSIARAYADWCFQWRAQLPPEWTAVEAGTTDAKAQELLKRRFESCYPFHPATLSVFQRKWQTVPQYQQTRGTLAMFAQWISWVYREDHLRARREPLMTLGSAPLEVPEFRATVVGQLGEHRLIPAIEHDIAGERSHARALDADTKGRLSDIHRHVGTAIFFESSGGMVDKVAHLPELRFALGEPDLDIASIDNAADALERRAFYLRKVGADGYRFGFRATLKKVVADRRASLDEQRDVQPAVRQLVRNEFERGATLSVVPFPKDGAAVPDTPQMTIVVMDPDFEWDGTEGPQAQIVEWTRLRGSDTRRYPAALVWCVKKPGRSLQDQVETLLAWRRVADELRAGLLSSEVDPAETQEATSKVKVAETDAREEVWASYGYLVVADRGMPAGVKVIDLAGGYSNAGQTLTGRILATLKTEGLFTESVGAGYIGRNWPVALRGSGAWPLQGLRQSFLDGSLVRLVDPERTLREQIVRWVEAGEFGLASGQRPDGIFQRVWFREPAASEEVTFDAQTFLLTPEKAMALTRPPEPKPPASPQPVPVEPTPGKPRPAESVITLRVHGPVSPEVWNRLGVRLIPRLKSGQNLSLSFDAIVQAQGEMGRHLEQDIRQALSELGLGGSVSVDVE